MPGKVYLVGAGPGDPDLLTLKALKVLKSADVVLHDALISPEILAYIPRSAQVQDVGKRCGQKSTPQEEINRLLVSYALLGMQVVRLKGGDPLIFGRSGEEIEALRLANVEYEIVPGITAALGAAAAAKFPLTHRKNSSALIFLTSHHAKNAADETWPENIPSNATVVIYMPGRNLAPIAAKLRQSGVNGETPCAVISQVSSANERVVRTSLDQLPSVPALAAPSLLVVGEVARMAEHPSLNAEPAGSFPEDRLSSWITEMGLLAGGQEHPHDRHSIEQESAE